MKLVELLRTKFVDGKTMLTSTELNEMKDELIECDEFKETYLVIMDLPITKDKYSDEVISAANYLLHKGTTFKDVSYLYSISLTPEVYDPITLYQPVKNGCSITPALFNPETFLTYRQIILSSEDLGDRKALHDKLDDILNNQREYMVKGKKSILIRGKFPIKEMENNVNPEQEYL
jgi:hypothetical protein